jgi:uncharacterized protein with HEPN domain
MGDACAFVLEITANITVADYASDRRLRQSVERNFQIIGEALRRLERTDPATAARISEYRSVIGLRNRLVHNYDDIDNEEVWEIIQHFLPVLRRETELLVQEAEDDWSVSESATE